MTTIAQRLESICRASFERRISADPMISLGWPAAEDFVGTEFEAAAAQCEQQFGDLCASELAKKISVRAPNPYEEIRTFEDGSHVLIQHEMAIPCEAWQANCTDAAYYDNE
ncbi:hypothetical protein [Azonexus sp. R2A61]|uniref:hypothetical protein n=1 Tax=Azonexus sp. R2A61 TaxID=2744443 RepID=UPI001F3D858C|nr:hypothetical protein [Azonexus sp. R2A61]